MDSFRTRPVPLLATWLTLAALAGAQTTYLLQTLAGSDEAGDGGPATAALISQAEGVAVDPLGGFFIADADGHRVRHVSPSGVITTVAGNGHPGFSGDNGPAAAAQLNTPYGIAADRAGNLLIADFGNARIRRISKDGIITTVAGGGTLAPSAADGHPATEAALGSPRNVTADAYGNTYFSEFTGHRVWQVTPSGVLLRLAGTGAPGLSGDNGPALQAALNSPAGLAVDANQTLYVADSGNARIRKIWRGVITTTGDSGRAGTPPVIPVGTPTGLTLDPDGSLIIADAANNQLIRVTPLMQIATLAQPARDVAIDAAGNLYTCSGSYVYKRTRSGLVSVVAGSGSYNFWGDGGPAGKARFNRPSGITRDAVGALYIADTSNHRIRRMGADGILYTVAGTGTAGTAGEGGPGLAAQLSAPEALVADRFGNLYIADTGNHRIRKLDAAGTLRTIGGTGRRGFSGDNGPATLAQLDSPGGIALDADGNLCIADTGNHVIRRISPDGRITTLAGNGNRGYAGDGGPPLLAGLDSPRGVAVDSAGNLFISDTGNHRIRRVSTGGGFGAGIINTYPSNSAAIWKQPRGLAVDDSGNLFLADAADQRIFLIEPAGRIAAIAGDGWPGFLGEAAPALSARIDTPLGLIVDAGGNLYFADSGNNRIRKLTPNVEIAPPPSLDAPLTVVNAASLLPGPVARGEMVTLFGTGLAADGAVTEVLFDGHPAALFFVQSTQINLQVPYSIGNVASSELQVRLNGAIRARIQTGVVDSNPGLFTTGGGIGQVAALNEDGTLNSAANAAPRGSIVILYATGEGALSPPLGDGQPAGASPSFPVLPVSLRIGDYPADILYAGSAPGFAGLMQVNARVPGGFAPTGILPVVLQVGTNASQSGAVMAVR